MNVGIDIRKLHDYGIGTHIRNVVLAAAESDSSRKYFLYCDPDDQQTNNGHFTWIPESSRKYSVSEHFTLARKASEMNIDLFHSPHYTLPLRLKCRSIVTIHDLIHLKFPQYFPGWKVKAAKFVMNQAIQKADVILSVSETTKTDILELFPTAKNKIEIVYNRLSNEWQNEGGGIRLADLGIDSEFLLYVGNFKLHKSIDTLVNAYLKLKSPPSLVLVGNTGAMDSGLLETVSRNPMIRIFGYAQHNLLRSLYSETILFIFPSLYEGFGYPPLEAMACGAPVLSSDAPALKEILADDAEFFERGNTEQLAHKIQMLIDDSNKRKSMRANGPKRAQKFMTDESPRKILKIYERLSK